MRRGLASGADRDLTSVGMNASDVPRGRPPWIAILAGVVLVAGLSAAWWLSRPPQPPAPPPAASLEPPVDAIHQALRAARDSAEIKSRWVDELPNVDLAGLDAARREIFVRFANAERRLADHCDRHRLDREHHRA